jgi:hypothetical protein
MDLMSDDDYLWDKSGGPDPDVARLERTLGAARHRPRAFTGAAASAAGAVAKPARPRRRRVVAFAAATAGALALAAGAALFVREPVETPSPTPIAATTLPVSPAASGWAVARLAGTPRVADAAITANGRLGLGEWLETDRASRAQITVAEIGHVEVAPGSRVRLVASGTDQHRLDLAQGRIDAAVNAPPRLFVVGTPAVTAVDLGCAYTLEVDEDGSGSITVRSGWVSLEDGSRTALVPAGARCDTRPGKGPGTPHFGDASPALRAALLAFDFGTGGGDAVRAVLHEARPRDSLTVWHLLSRVEEPLRAEVLRRLTALRPPPPGVDEAQLMRLDPQALDAWKEELTATW